MDIRSLGMAGRKVLPPSVFQFVRKIGTAVLTPFLFSWRTGHFRSALLGKAVDSAGCPIPWYSYPAIEFLSGKDFRDKSVLEWGAGQSTVWWSARARRVVALESSAAWCESVERKRLPNVSVHRVDAGLNALPPAAAGEFDLIVIDGLDRVRAASFSIDLLKEGGAILLDNSEQYWCEGPEYPILDLFRNRGFQRVDFFGMAPGVIQPHCTSLFFRSTCFLLSGAENPKRV